VNAISPLAEMCHSAGRCDPAAGVSSSGATAKASVAATVPMLPLRSEDSAACGVWRNASGKASGHGLAAGGSSSSSSSDGGGGGAADPRLLARGVEVLAAVALVEERLHVPRAPPVSPVDPPGGTVGGRWRWPAALEDPFLPRALGLALAAAASAATSSSPRMASPLSSRGAGAGAAAAAGDEETAFREAPTPDASAASAGLSAAGRSARPCDPRRRLLARLDEAKAEGAGPAEEEDAADGEEAASHVAPREGEEGGSRRWLEEAGLELLDLDDDEDDAPSTPDAKRKQEFAEQSIGQQETEAGTDAGTVVEGLPDQQSPPEDESEDEEGEEAGRPDDAGLVRLRRKLRRHEISWPQPTSLGTEDHLSRAFDIRLFWFFEARDRMAMLVPEVAEREFEPLEGVSEYPPDWPQWKVDSFNLREAARSARRRRSLGGASARSVGGDGSAAEGEAEAVPPVGEAVLVGAAAAEGSAGVSRIPALAPRFRGAGPGTCRFSPRGPAGAAPRPSKTPLKSDGRGTHAAGGG